MRVPGLVGALFVLSAFTVQSAPPAPQVTILTPPDGFFAEIGTLDVVVAYSTRRGNQIHRLQLLVNGEILEDVALPASEDSGLHTFHVDVAPENPIALVQAIGIHGGSHGSPPMSVATVRAAGSSERQRLRATLEEMEEIARAVERYADCCLAYGADLPTSLEALVPEILSVLPTVSPLGTSYEYSARGPHYQLQTQLPGNAKIRIDDGTFTEIPQGAITDREAARLIRQQLQRIAVALEEYRIDNNQFPEELEELTLEVYLRFFPTVDPYGNPFLAELQAQAYQLRSLGRDGLAGGTGFDADTIVETEVNLIAAPDYRGEREYVDKAIVNLRSLRRWILYSAEQTGHLPAALTELEPGFPAGWIRDLCGNEYRYETHDVGDHWYFVVAADGCDGTRGTDFTERYVSGTYPSSCAPEQGLVHPLSFPGLFD